MELAAVLGSSSRFVFFFLGFGEVSTSPDSGGFRGFGRLDILIRASGSFSSRYLRLLESLRGGGALSSYVLCTGTCL
jgi:hypothetical protein